ncbi:TetR/AcrR family transcriptional regulator [Nonomuraea turkmeniaca]|uniref:TetR/AcrR family transcriptional regulator n=1 Tax=Nonomuraea turkmeniaca TaxID=103838 RepID=UPI00147707F0|nr:TetR/AcrR family transcriptional regulator [Nonomuraea turkmeniaca]
MPSARRHGKATKRDAILGAAVELLLAGGYENTSMDAVAAAAGVSKTTVYAHFADKSEIFEAVMRKASADFRADLEAALQRVRGDNPADRIATALVEILKAATAPQFVAYFRLLVTESERRVQLNEVFEDARVSGPDVVGVVATLLEAEAKESGYEIVHPERFATILLRLVVSGTQLDLLISDFRPDADLLETHVRFVVRMFLQGIRPGPGARHAELPTGYDYPWGPELQRM